MKKMFEEFESSSFAEWMNKIETDLKGKSIDLLTSHPEPDLEVVAYHHQENMPQLPDNGIARKLNRATNTWKVRQEFDGTNKNSELLDALNNGVDAIGISVDSDTDFSALTNDVLFKHIQSDIRFNDISIAVNFQAPVNSRLNFDCIGLNAANGAHDLNLADFHTFYEKQSAHKSIWVTGENYGKAGASTVQELAFTLAHLNEYIQHLSSKGVALSEINQKIIIELSVNENYFVNMAKFRVIQDLVQLVFSGYNPDYSTQPVEIYARTNIRHLAQNDKNNNPLRETTQAMSAVIGGCDVLTVEYGRTGTTQEVARFQRLAKNIQLVLKEEAYLDKVVDPAGGSYYIESLSQQLLEKSWNLFLEVENAGGLIVALSSNLIQDKIQTTKAALIASLRDNKRTFLGVNKHPNNMEDWVEPTVEYVESETPFTPLRPFYLEHHFLKTVSNHE